ncbi:unnamed protein product [Rhizoctonia solani]|uniref:Uncharacterized protein n=1 Tax=Rhizoctonia solani TaxID=456999 RepID=A0A8H3AZD2_9AGAM|nr:unnamed protein product [Rhizoctonia solani]
MPLALSLNRSISETSMLKGLSRSMTSKATKSSPNGGQKVAASSRNPTLYGSPVIETEKPIIRCWVDAATSTRMVAVVIESEREYQVFRLKPDWKSDGRDINWMEAITFELLASFLLARQYTGRVLVNSDSTAAISTFAGSGGRSRHLREVGSRLRRQSSEWPFIMRAQLVKGRANIADPFSRGRAQEGYKKSEFLVEIPHELKRFVSNEE